MFCSGSVVFRSGRVVLGVLVDGGVGDLMRSTLLTSNQSLLPTLDERADSSPERMVQRARALRSAERVVLEWTLVWCPSPVFFRAPEPLPRGEVGLREKAGASGHGLELIDAGPRVPSYVQAACSAPECYRGAVPRTCVGVTALRHV